MKYDPKAPVVIVAPHLDDAVLSCFNWLVDADSDVRVVTLFAGLPKGNVPASRWDELCGFPGGLARDVMDARRAEDIDALAGLAKPIHLDGLDNQYRQMIGAPAPSVIRLGTELLKAVRSASRLLAPATLSPSPHPDHLLAREAVVGLARPNRIPCDLYADVPHCLKDGYWPGFEVGLLGPEPGPKWWVKCLADCPIERDPEMPMWGVLSTADRELKAERMRRYASQFKGLTTALRDPGRGVLKKPDLYGIECSWHVEGTP